MHKLRYTSDGDREEKQPAFIAGLALCVGIALLGYLGFTVYEGYVLGLPFLPYEVALFTPYHLARSAFALVASGLIVWTIGRGWDGGGTPGRSHLRPGQRVAALAIMAAALAFTAVFLLSPSAFERFAAEDTALEWASAIFVLIGSGLFAADFLHRLRRRPSGNWRNVLGVAIAGSFAILFFLIGMEEISWMQRLLGFETPPAMAEANWQSEFNLHNFQTYLVETAYYSGAAIFLILLPLIAEAAPKWPPLRAVSDFVPGRFAVAASAPISIFNYGHWNIIPIQITAMITVFVLLAYAKAAARRQDGFERLLFLFLAAGVAAGQAVYLVHGPSMSYVPNTTEYKEFFIALGLGCFALEACRRTRQAAGAAHRDVDAGFHLAADSAVP